MADEIEVRLGGKTYDLLVTYEAVVAIEEKVGGLFEVYRRLEAGSLSTAATVIWAAMTTGGKQPGGPSLEEVGELVLQENFASLSRPLARYLARLIRGKDDEDEPEEES